MATVWVDPPPGDGRLTHGFLVFLATMLETSDDDVKVTPTTLRRLARTALNLSALTADLEAEVIDLGERLDSVAG